MVNYGVVFASVALLIAAACVFPADSTTFSLKSRAQNIDDRFTMVHQRLGNLKALRSQSSSGSADCDWATETFYIDKCIKFPHDLSVSCSGFIDYEAQRVLHQEEYDREAAFLHQVEGFVQPNPLPSITAFVDADFSLWEDGVMVPGTGTQYKLTYCGSLGLQDATKIIDGDVDTQIYTYAYLPNNGEELECGKWVLMGMKFDAPVAVDSFTVTTDNLAGGVLRFPDTFSLLYSNFEFDIPSDGCIANDGELKNQQWHNAYVQTGPACPTEDFQTFTFTLDAPIVATTFALNPRSIYDRDTCEPVSGSTQSGASNGHITLNEMQLLYNGIVVSGNP